VCVCVCRLGWYFDSFLSFSLKTSTPFSKKANIDSHHTSCINEGATSVEFDEIIVECTSTLNGETVFDNYVAQYEVACFQPTSPNCTTYNDTFCTEWLGIIASYRTDVLIDLGHTNVSCLAVDGSETCRYLTNINHINYDRDVLTCFNAIREWEITNATSIDTVLNTETVGNSVVSKIIYDTGT
jgi:hypothetical protein